MKNLTFYLIVIIVILSGIGYTFYSLNEMNKKNAERWEQNAHEKDKSISQFNLTFKEFKRSIDSKTDSILEIAKIKPKNVKQITVYNNHYTDTTITIIEPLYEPQNNTYPFIDKVGCFEFSGFMEVKDTVPVLNVENRAFNSDFTEIEHYEKDTIHIFRLNLVKWWQSKRLTYTTIDNCTGEKRIKKFNIK